ncbi:sialidase family protein [Prosthecobacter sp.]|uniref:sialidase family protein n=1 Tax=Prosthecobacter sp. TaxID=1965333 RepID=UPI002AB8A6A7|nr:sialidase family protein [Prosthecobacter sp.]MDZ4406035.1 sialidase family protein [Prosthecobacter sp.]
MRTLLFLLAGLLGVLQAEPPKVTVTNIRRVFHNGEHNAFTDLVRFKGQLYLCFRSCPNGHMVFNTASVIIMRSTDEGATWTQVHRFSVKDRDTRDPHFLDFNGQLFLYTGTWWTGSGLLDRKDYDMNKQLGFAVSSPDGTKWSDPTLLEGTFGYYIWRAATCDGKAYLCGRRKANFAVSVMGERGHNQSIMLESDDGIIFRHRAYFQESGGNETAFFFEKDGSVLALDRNGGGNSMLASSKPPYTDWNRRPLDRFVGGPLLVKWSDHILVGGRNQTKDRGPKTSLGWLVGDKFHEFAELPSGGDNSYPGFIELSPTKGLISWYSSHEKDEASKTITAIYLAELNLSP